MFARVKKSGPYRYLQIGEGLKNRVGTVQCVIGATLSRNKPLYSCGLLKSNHSPITLLTPDILDLSGPLSLDTCLERDDCMPLNIGDSLL